MERIRKNLVFKILNLKLLFTAVLTLCSILSFSQVKIGDNPSTIDVNSLLEMESATKGVLIPRVVLNDVTTVAPLTGTVSVGMLIYNEGGTETDGFYYWDGSQYRIFNTSLNTNTRDNYVLVKSLADLPAPSGGIITLAAGTVYDINGTISVTSQIDLNGSYLIGLNANTDILSYTLGSGALFTGNNGGTIKTLTLVAPMAGSKIFNVEDLTASKSLVVRDCIVANSKDVGLIKGFNTVFMNVINYSGNTSGITYQDITHLLLEDQAWFSNNSGTFETYVGAFSILERLGGFAESTSGNTAIDVTGVTSVLEGEVKNGSIAGDGTRVAGTFSKNWEVEAPGIDTETDDVASGHVYITTPILTIISASNTPVKVLGTTTIANTFRFTSTVDNRLTYDGTKVRVFEVSASLSMTSPVNGKRYSFCIAKNGVALPGTNQQRKIANGGDIGALTITGTVELAPSDYVEIWVSNNNTAHDITIVNMSLSVK